MVTDLKTYQSLNKRLPKDPTNERTTSRQFLTDAGVIHPPTEKDSKEKEMEWNGALACDVLHVAMFLL